MNQLYQRAQKSSHTNSTPVQPENKMNQHSITNTNDDDAKEPSQSSTPLKSSPQNTTGQIQTNLGLSAPNSDDISIFNSNLNNNNNKIVILDWDDTIVPTSIITQSTPQTHFTFDELKYFGNAMYDFLVEYILQFGSENIYIVTNAIQEWVWESLQILTKDYQNFIDDHMIQNMINNTKRPCLINYFAQIRNLLCYENIKSRIYSARSLHEKYYPKDSLKWKVLTFKDIITRHFRLNAKNIDCDQEFMIVCIGDGVDEFQASQIVQRMLIMSYKLKNVHLHRYKLANFPTLGMMTKQAIMVRDRAEYIAVSDKSDTLRFTESWSDRSKYIHCDFNEIQICNNGSMMPIQNEFSTYNQNEGS